MTATEATVMTRTSMTRRTGLPCSERVNSPGTANMISQAVAMANTSSDRRIVRNEGAERAVELALADDDPGNMPRARRLGVLRPRRWLAADAPSMDPASRMTSLTGPHSRATRRHAPIYLKIAASDKKEQRTGGWISYRVRAHAVSLAARTLHSLEANDPIPA